jgi:hypothetical protein
MGEQKSELEGRNQNIQKIKIINIIKNGQKF